MHFSAQHAIADIATLFLIVRIVEKTLAARQLLAIMFTTTTVISIGLLYFVPTLGVYRGSSGLLTSLAVLAGGFLWKNNASTRFVIVCAAMVLTFKTWLDHYGSSLHSSSLPDGVVVVWQAHLAGALIGALTLAYYHYCLCSPYKNRYQ